uniref:RHS repeat-associated core domain-containing protein n=1 Tax=Ilumatobacter sp. TaxID=1967498 RepID=UPI0026265525
QPGPSGWTAGASSSQSLPGDGEVSFRFSQDSGHPIMVGLNDTDTGTGYAELDYAIYHNAAGNIYIYEHGTNTHIGPPASPGDVYTIQRTDTQIDYLINGTLLYASTQPASGSYLVDTSLHTGTGGITDTTITTHANHTRHVYDTGGQRVLRVDPDGTKTIYLGATQLRWTPNDPTIDVARHYPGGTHRGFDGTITHTIAGHHNSIIATVNATTAAVTHNRYHPYGQLRHGTTVDDTGFLNQPHDPTGLVYLHHRHHDPTLGTFTSVDPLVAITGEAYIYGSANPVSFSDPDGLCTGRTCNAEDNQAVRDAQRRRFAEWEAALLEAESRGHGGDVRAQGFFIARVLDAYHDSVGISIANQSGASFEIGCAIPGGLPDLCRPGMNPKPVGELKYGTPWSEEAGQRQLSGYRATPGVEVNRAEFGSAGSTLAGVIRLNWWESTTAGLYLYRVDNWSIGQLLAGMAATYEANRAAQNASRTNGPTATATVPVLVNSSTGWLPSVSIPRIEPGISTNIAVMWLGMASMAGGAMLLHGR